MQKTQIKQVLIGQNKLGSKVLEKCTTYNYFLMILSISIFANTAAVYTENILGYLPCNLCLYARFPYFMSTIFSLAALICKNYQANIKMLFCITLCILVSISISILHIGIEMDWWAPSGSCSNNIDFKQDLSLEELKKIIDRAPLGNCAVVNFTIMGFSMSELNFLINIVLLFLSIKVIFYEKSINKFTTKRYI